MNTKNGCPLFSVVEVLNYLRVKVFNFSLGPVYLCSLFLLEAIFMLSKAEVMQCSHSTLMTDNEVECVLRSEIITL